MQLMLKWADFGPRLTTCCLLDATVISSKTIKYSLKAKIVSFVSKVPMPLFSFERVLDSRGIKVEVTDNTPLISPLFASSGIN